MTSRDGLRSGDVIAGRYRIVRPIGAGGMGAVYEAEQLTLGRSVALKVLFDDDERALARFEQEARALARISHPNVVAVYEFHRADAERALLVMELLEGESLATVLRRERRFGIERTSSIADAVLRGLEAAHERGIVHRDLKPSNIFLTRDGGVKIVDFGIAKILDSPNLHTTLGTIVGTPSYLAPEQLHGEPPDARTDLHALGVCLYEMLTGRKPWRAHGHMDLAAEILRDVPPSVTTLRPDVPHALADVIDCALSKDRSARFSGAAEMRRSLSSKEAIFLAGPTATSPRPVLRSDPPGKPRAPWTLIAVSSGLFFSVISLFVAMAMTGKLSRKNGPVFGEADRAALQGGAPLAGREEIYGTDCHCLPLDFVAGSVNQTTALRCPQCSGVAVNGSWRCSGLGADGQPQEGRYLCRNRTLGRAVPRAGSQGAAPLY